MIIVVGIRYHRYKDHGHIRAEKRVRKCLKHNYDIIGQSWTHYHEQIEFLTDLLLDPLVVLKYSTILIWT